MRTTIEMAREAGIRDCTCNGTLGCLERFASLVRADERDSWPAEMEAMERQVNILTDALHQEREACAKLCENKWSTLAESKYGEECADAIRARSNT